MAHKSWLRLSLSLACLILAGCSTNDNGEIPAPPQPAYDGPIEEIPGVEPRYEPSIPSANQDYRRDGQRYTIVRDPSDFAQIGLATSYGEERRGSLTASGEPSNPDALSAAHPTLPIPSYVRVTNLANGRRLVVRINDRGPYTPGRIIDLSSAAANRLNLTQHTKVRVDIINVAADGSLSGPGTIGTQVAKQSYALASRPQLGMTSPPLATDANPPALHASSEPTPTTLSPADDGQHRPPGAPTRQGNGSLDAPQPLRRSVLEESVPSSAPAPATATVASHAANGHYLVQVGTVSSSARAIQWQQQLSQRFAVPGKVEVNNNLYRVQLGPFANRAQASTLQQRLSSEGLSSFITSTP